MTIAAQPIITLLSAELAEQASWSTHIPAWHPRAEGEAGAAPAAVEAGQAPEAVTTDPQAGGDELFAPYLQGVPQELHPLALQALRAQNADFTRRFQEASQFRSQMEPLTKVEGFSDLKPEDVEFFVGLNQTLQDPEAAKQWVQSVASQLGITPELDQESWTALGQENGWAGQPSAPEAGTDQQAIVQAVMEAIGPQLQPLQQYVEGQQATQAQTAAAERFNSRWTELASQNGLVSETTPPEDAQRIKAAVTSLAHAHLASEDPIGEAVKQYMEITGTAQGDLMEQKIQTRTQGLGNGSADTAPQTPSWNGTGPSPKDLALARMR